MAPGEREGGGKGAGREPGPLLEARYEGKGTRIHVKETSGGFGMKALLD
jgi:hypothetical protein